jgi:hypothetical protein
VTSDRRRRARNLGAWLVGALVGLAALLLALCLLVSPDPAWGGVYGTLFFGGFFGLGSIFFGLVGYALLASFWPSSASGVGSLVAGGVAAILMLVCTYLLMPLGPGASRLVGAAVISAAWGATSCAVANPMPSKNRWRGS